MLRDSRVLGSPRNESGASFAWMLWRLGELRLFHREGPMEKAWSHLRRRMLNAGLNREERHIWASDPWIARGAETIEGRLVPRWDPPQGISMWPTMNVRRLVDLKVTLLERTNHESFAELLVDASRMREFDSMPAISSYYEMRDGLKRHADVSMIVTEHVRCWLHAAV